MNNKTDVQINDDTIQQKTHIKIVERKETLTQEKSCTLVFLDFLQRQKTLDMLSANKTVFC